VAAVDNQSHLDDAVAIVELAYGLLASSGGVANAKEATRVMCALSGALSLLRAIDLAGPSVSES
jgi:hypothetical protein